MPPQPEYAAGQNEAIPMTETRHKDRQQDSGCGPSPAHGDGAWRPNGYSQTDPPCRRDAPDDAMPAPTFLVSAARPVPAKTVAFGIAVAPTLLARAQRFERAEKPLGLVIAPTRELAMQVERETGLALCDAAFRSPTCVRRHGQCGNESAAPSPWRGIWWWARPADCAINITKARSTTKRVARRCAGRGRRECSISDFREDLEFILGPSRRAPQS